MEDALNRTLDLLDTEDDDSARADLIETVFVICDRDPSLAPIARAAGIPT